MKRTILDDHGYPLIEVGDSRIDHAHRDGELQVSPLQFIGYVLAAIAIVGIVWLVASIYILVGTPQ